MTPSQTASPQTIKLVSWNLLHRDGAGLGELARLIERHRPDLLMMQEVKASVADIQRLVGGHFAWEPLPGRVHGLGLWTPHPTRKPHAIVSLPKGAMVRRISQMVELGPITVANVHLSHGQLLNRRQLRSVVQHLPANAAVVGDYNMVGPTMLAGFSDVGPRGVTHRMSRFVPLRLDRCLVRGLVCTEASVLQRGGSDHHPIMLKLQIG